MVLEPEEVDLAALAEVLDATFAKELPVGYLPGKTAFRDAVAEHLECSSLEAEDVVDTMIGRGFLRYEGDPARAPADLEPWRIDTSCS